jgi:hypothetical protein
MAASAKADEAVRAYSGSAKFWCMSGNLILLGLTDISQTAQQLIQPDASSSILFMIPPLM